MKPGEAHFAFGAQGLQPRNQQFTHFLLSQQFANPAGNFCERRGRSTGLFQPGDKLVAIVSFHRPGIDLHRRTQSRIHQPHHLNLLPDVSE